MEPKNQDDSGLWNQEPKNQGNNPIQRETINTALRNHAPEPQTKAREPEPLEPRNQDDPGSRNQVTKNHSPGPTGLHIQKCIFVCIKRNFRPFQQPTVSLHRRFERWHELSEPVVHKHTSLVGPPTHKHHSTLDSYIPISAHERAAT